MALILFTRSRAPLVKTSRSLKNEFRKGKCSYQFVTAVCRCACNAYRGVMTLAVFHISISGRPNRAGSLQVTRPCLFLGRRGNDSQGDNLLIIRLIDILGDAFTQTALNGRFRVVTSCCERARYRTFRTRWGGCRKEWWL